MDIYCLSFVGWEAHLAESAWLGADVIEKSALRQRLHAKPLVMHSNNGSPMSLSMPMTNLTELGMTPFNSRPWVQHDNAFIESLVETLKATPRFLSGGFKCVDTCRE